MPNKDTTPLSLYGNDREYLREQEKTNELLADIAGEEYESPGDIPNGKYVIQKRLLDAAQKKNELLESIAEGGGGSGAAKGLNIDYATDVISLKNKDGDVIAGSGATLPAYGVSFDPTTGGLTLTKNGTAMQGQTVTIPNYGSPVGVTDSADMVDEGTIYLYEGTTGGGFTNGHFYYYDGSAWADGGEYAAATVQTDKTLLVEDRAADAKATGEAVGELKTQIDTLTEAVATEEPTTVTEDIWDSITWTSGYYSAANGTIHESSAHKYSNKIPVSPGDVLAFANTTKEMRFITAYSDDTNVVESKGSNTGLNSYNVPDGIHYLVITVAITYANLVLNRTYTDVRLQNNLKDNVEELESSVENLENELGNKKTIYAVNNPAVTVAEGYYWNGFHTSTSYYYVHITGLKKDDVVYVTLLGSPTKITARFIDAYLGNQRNADESIDVNTTTYTVPENVDNIYFSYAVTYSASVTVNIRTTETVFVPKAYVGPNGFTWNFDLSANAKYTTDKNLQDICEYRISFFAKIGTVSGETRIGKDETGQYGGAIGFDSTNLYEYLGNVTTPVRTQAHGLTIVDYIGIVINLHYDGTAAVTIASNSGSYTWDLPYWRSRRGELTVYSDSALTDCTLSYTCEGILKKTWLYGDSYFDNTGDIRWTSYLVKAGYTNYLLNGYPGRGSAIAMISLKTDMELGKMPDRIIWCLGMNDPDTSSGVNTAWKDAVEELSGICERNNIELILATIPNVPSISNEYKNAYVKASGYRYIPFAAAISADESSTWYDGMLETVPGGGYGIHPTEQGAICLYNSAISSVPELLL